MYKRQQFKYSCNQWNPLKLMSQIDWLGNLWARLGGDLLMVMLFSYLNRFLSYFCLLMLNVKVIVFNKIFMYIWDFFRINLLSGLYVWATFVFIVATFFIHLRPHIFRYVDILLKALWFLNRRRYMYLTHNQCFYPNNYKKSPIKKTFVALSQCQQHKLVPTNN